MRANGSAELDPKPRAKQGVTPIDSMENIDDKRGSVVGSVLSRVSVRLEIHNQLNFNSKVAILNAIFAVAALLLAYSRL